MPRDVFERFIVSRLLVSPLQYRNIDVATVDKLRIDPRRLGKIDLKVPRIRVEKVVTPLGSSLGSLGLLPTPGGADSVRDALREFQKRHGLPETGILGHDDLLEIAAALDEEEVPTEAFITSLKTEDPEAFGHDVEWPLVKEGEKSTAVRLIQLRVNELGHGTLTVDGDFGPNTAKGVRAAQQALGLGVDGKVGKNTWNALVAGMAPLSPGASGEAVKTAQLRLIELAYADFEAQGNFGPKTLAALHSFQVESGLPTSDTIGEDTWRYLFGSSFASTPADVFAAVKFELNTKLTAGLPKVPEGSRSSVSSVMQSAIDSYGIREIPEGSNRGPEVDALVGTRGWAWCALSVSAWLKRGLNAASWAEIPFGKEMASANGIRDWGHKGGRFLPAADVPPGAVFVMNRDTGTATAPSTPFNKGHVGFVVEDQGSTVLTLEGNSHDSVRSLAREKSSLVGCVRWWA